MHGLPPEANRQPRLPSCRPCQSCRPCLRCQSCRPCLCCRPSRGRGAESGPGSVRRVEPTAYGEERERGGSSFNAMNGPKLRGASAAPASLRATRRDGDRVPHFTLFYESHLEQALSSQARSGLHIYIYIYIYIYIHVREGYPKGRVHQSMMMMIFEGKECHSNKRSRVDTPAE